MSSSNGQKQISSDNIIFLDFEDTAVLNAIPDEMALLDYIESHRKESLCYVFLDEVQRVEGWAGACRTLRIRNCSIFISGSNSKLLSREFTKELSGRYVPFRIRPFVYKELSEYGKELGKEITLTDCRINLIQIHLNLDMVIRFLLGQKNHRLDVVSRAQQKLIILQSTLFLFQFHVLGYIPS